MNIPEGYALVPVEPDDEIIRRMLAVRWPATYRSCLRFHGSGPETSARTESDIFEAKKQYTAAISTISIKPSYDEAKERDLFEDNITKIANEKNYYFMNDLLKRHAFDDSYRITWVDMAWLGWSECAKSRARSAE